MPATITRDARAAAALQQLADLDRLTAITARIRAERPTAAWLTFELGDAGELLDPIVFDNGGTRLPGAPVAAIIDAPADRQAIVRLATPDPLEWRHDLDLEPPAWEAEEIRRTLAARPPMAPASPPEEQP